MLTYEFYFPNFFSSKEGWVIWRKKNLIRNDKLSSGFKCSNLFESLLTLFYEIFGKFVFNSIINIVAPR